MTTFEKIKTTLRVASEPTDVESLQGFIAGKCGQWINQQSHVDRDEAAFKAMEIIKLLFTPAMYEVCMPGGKFDRSLTNGVADNFFQILAWHYQI